MPDMLATIAGTTPMDEADDRGGDRPLSADEAASALTEHLDVAFRVAYGYFRNEQDAADAVQDAYIDLLRSSPGATRVRSRRAWICASVTNACHKRQRRERRLKQREREFALQPRPDAAEERDDDQLRDAVRRCALALPERYRLPLLLHYFERCTVDEIAESLRHSPAAVRKQLQRGVERLRRSLARQACSVDAAVLPALLASMPLPAAPASLAAALPGLPAIAVAAPAAAAPTLAALTLAKMTLAKLVSVFAALGLVGGVLWFTSVDTRTITPVADQAPRAAAAPTAIDPSAWSDGVRVIGAGRFQAPWPVRAVAFSPDNRHLAVGCEPGHGKAGGVVIWDIETRREARRVPFVGTVSDLRYDPQGAVLHVLLMVDQRENDRLVAWDLATDRSLFEIPVPNYYGRIELAPSRGAVLAVNGPRIDLHADDVPGFFERLVGEKHTPFYDYRRQDVMSWSLRDGAALRTWEGVARTEAQRKWSVQQFDVSRDGRRVACIDDCHGASGGAAIVREPRMTILDWSTGEVRHRWPLTDDAFGWDSALAWLPDGAVLMTSSATVTRFWNAADGKFLRELPGRGALAADGSRVVCATPDAIRTYDAASGDLVDTLAIEVPESHREMELSPDGRWLAAAVHSQQTPLLVDLRQRGIVAPLAGSFRSLPGIRHTADGRLLANDGDSTVFLAEDGSELRRMPMSLWYGGWTDHAWSPDGRLVVVPQEGGAQIWDTVEGRRIATCSGHGGGYVDAAFLSADLRYAASLGPYDGMLKIHRLADGQVLQQIHGPVHGSFGCRLHLAGLFWDLERDRILIGDTNAVWFNDAADMKSPSAYGDADVAGIIDLASGGRLHRFVDDTGVPARTARLLACGHGLVYGAASFGVKPFGHGLVVSADERFCLWRSEDGSFVRATSDVGSDPIFSADGSRLIGSAGIIDVTGGGLIQRFEAGWRLSPSRTLAAALDDRMRLSLIDVASGQLVWRQRLLDGDGRATLRALSWSPLENRLAITVEEGVALMQVELFRQAPAVDGLDPDRALALLGHEALEQRMRGVERLLQAGAAAVPLLERHLERHPAAAESATARVMAIIALERLARAGATGAAELLATIADPCAAAARDRLERARRSTVLRRAPVEVIDLGLDRGRAADPAAEGQPAEQVAPAGNAF